MFSALTSGTYLINDLFDIEADRQHPRKRNRPFAAGVVTPLTGVKVAVALIGGALLAGFWGIGFGFGMGLLSYLVMTMTYTFVLKSLSTIDVIVLGLLFTVRVVAGGLATGILISPWLLTFLFLLRQSRLFETLHRTVQNEGCRKASQPELLARGTVGGSEFWNHHGGAQPADAISIPHAPGRPSDLFRKGLAVADHSSAHVLDISYLDVGQSR